MKAIVRTTRITPKKANLIAGMVRGKNVNESLDILKFTPKKAAKILFKLVKSATENAKNNFKQEADTLFIKEVIVGKGPTLKRSVPVSRGRVYPILKRTSHITILLGVKVESATQSKAKKSTTKQVEDKTRESITEEPKTTAKKTKSTKATKVKKEKSNTTKSKKS